MSLKGRVADLEDRVDDLESGGGGTGIQTLTSNDQSITITSAGAYERDIVVNTSHAFSRFTMASMFFANKLITGWADPAIVADWDDAHIVSALQAKTATGNAIATALSPIQKDMTDLLANMINIIGALGPFAPKNVAGDVNVAPQCLYGTHQDIKSTVYELLIELQYNPAWATNARYNGFVSTTTHDNVEFSCSYNGGSWQWWIEPNYIITASDVRSDGFAVTLQTTTTGETWLDERPNIKISSSGFTTAKILELEYRIAALESQP
jgi:hypothetical protein